MRHLIDVSDLSSSELERIFAITEDLKAKFSHGVRESLLPGRVMALLFEKPSLRTRVSLETAMAHLGGSSLFLGDDVGMGSREAIADFARVLSQYVDVIVVRSKRHQLALDVAAHSDCAVINGLTDLAHPCQAVADVYTLKELVGRLAGHTLAFVGDANNVARSLAEACGLVGMRFVIASPAGYEFRRPICSNCARACRGCSSTSRPIRSQPCAGPRPYTPTSGPAWGRSLKPTGAAATSPAFR